MRVIVLVLTTLFLLVLIGIGAGGGWLLYEAAKRAEPTYGGEIVASALQAPVEVRFGPHAIPTIKAVTRHDMLFAQGFVVASERVWQMDIMRRLARGRLAEVFGEDALVADRFYRTVGLADAAAASLNALDAPYRDVLDAYAAGVNAYIEHAGEDLPLEYLIAGFEPAPWEPIDSLAIGEFMAWTLAGNIKEELAFLTLSARVGNRRAIELFPTEEGVPAPSDTADLPRYTAALGRSLERLLAMPRAYGLPVPGPASNAWAVNGARTENGEALLANDPHLAPSTPAIWYELEMESRDYHAAGIALPGVPLILIGHNEHLAWGMTNAMADTQDLFIERPTPGGAYVERPGGEREAIDVRYQQVPVKGREDAASLTIRSTSQGVILNDLLDTNIDAMALARGNQAFLVALQAGMKRPDRAIVGLYLLNNAKTLYQARRAARRFTRASQNVLIAHRDGGISWQMTGELPKRGRGSGRFPAPGWEPGYGWTGYVSASANPSMTNPRGYALLSANQRMTPRDYPVFIGSSWAAPYRARRIEELLLARAPLTLEDMTAMQSDVVSVEMIVFKEALGRVSAHLKRFDLAAWEIAEAYLVDWDGSFALDSRSAAFFVVFREELYRAIYGDELKDDLGALTALANEGYNALDEALLSGRSSFWNDVATTRWEDEPHVWSVALKAAQERFRGVTGGSLRGIERLRFPHAFERKPFLGRFFGVGPIPVAGDDETISAIETVPDVIDEATRVPSYRVVFTPSDWRNTRGTLTLGQSGHRFSPFRTDQLDDWLNGETHRWPWGGPAADETIGTLRLEPAGSAYRDL